MDHDKEKQMLLPFANPEINFFQKPEKILTWNTRIAPDGYPEVFQESLPKPVLEMYPYIHLHCYICSKCTVVRRTSIPLKWKSPFVHICEPCTPT